MLKAKNMTTKIMLNYAFTFMIIGLSAQASRVIDELIISRNLGATLLAATGLGGSSYEMVSLFCGIFSVGLQSTCSRAMGSGNSEKTIQCFTGGLLAVSVIALLLTSFGFLGLDLLCRLFGADGSDQLLYSSLHE